MPLFDDMERNDLGAALYAEPSFTYLNRSARPGAQRIRALLEDWFAAYPDSHKPDLRARFRSRDDPQHSSSFFELFLHELLRRLECRVEIHPVRPSHRRNPDFLVTSPEGSSFYLEAVLVTEQSREEAAANARMNAVYDALNNLESPNFYIGMSLRGAPQTPPPARHIRTFLRGHLTRLDPDEIAKIFTAGGIQALPHWRYEHEGWVVQFFPIPKSPDRRGKPGIRPVALRFEGARYLETRIAIRDAIVEKAGGYGELDQPYVIALNASGDFVDRIDVMEALFGQEHFIFRGTLAGPSGPEFRRAQDGVWTSPSGPRYTRVSGVLVFIHSSPSTIPRASVCLYHNPWAAKPYGGVLNRLPRAAPKDGENMEWFEGEPIATILGVPPDWPGQ